MRILFSSIIFFFVCFHIQKQELFDKPNHSLNVKLIPSKKQENNFKQFLKLFYKQKLPISINDDNLKEYIVPMPNEIAYVDFYKNRYKIINDSLLKFIPNAKSNTRQNCYVAVYQIEISDKFHSIIYYKRHDNLEDEYDSSLWMFLCTYSKCGKLIDRVKLCGFTSEKIYQSAKIADNLEIFIHTYRHFPYDYDLNDFEAIETKINYSILENGKIKCYSSQSHRVLDNKGQPIEITPYKNNNCKD